MGPLKNNSRAIDLLYCSLILVVSVIIAYPLFNGKFFIGFDYGGGLMLLLSMKLCLGHGQWIVRWVPELCLGYGYPVFNFYPPLFSMVGTLIAGLGTGILGAYNLSLFLVLFLSGCAMYLFSREIWGREGGFISAVVYLLAPYHLFDIYVRAAGAESASFIFLPLILWSFYKLQQTARKRYVLFSALSSAGLLLTHNCISIMFFPLVAGYILFIFWPYCPYRRFISLAQAGMALALGFGLSAFFWLPAFIEKKYVKVYVLTQGYEDFHRHFLSPGGLLMPAWVYNMPWDARPAMSCQVGLTNALLILIVLLGFKKIVADNPVRRAQIIYFTMVLISAVFFVIPCSSAVWEHFQILKFVQFPFRFLAIIALAGSVITGGIVLLVKQEHRFKMIGVVVLLVVLANFSYCHPREFVDFDLGPAMTNSEKLLSGLALQDGGEYLPIGVKGWPSAASAQKLESLGQESQVLEAKEISPLHFIFKVQAQQGAVFCFNSFYFPGWTVNVDGKAQEILKENTPGLIVFPCPAGIHEVEVYFGTTPVRQLAQEIAAGSLIALAAFLFLRK